MMQLEWTLVAGVHEENLGIDPSVQVMKQGTGQPQLVGSSSKVNQETVPGEDGKLNQAVCTCT